MEFVPNKKMQDQSIQIRRPEHLAPRVVFVDGIEGCGKTMLAPIIAALDRVELLTYAYEIEHLCSLSHLGKIEDDAAAAMISMLADLQLYNTMQSREINFRPSDLSSVFRDSRPLRYFYRLFQRGDQFAAERIANENPILLLTTHKITAYCAPVFRALGKRATLIEVVRHPLYMLIQNERNFRQLISTVRDFTIYYDYKGKNIPYYARGWEDKYLGSNPVDKAIYYIQHLVCRSRAMKEKFSSQYNGQILTVPFEKYVVAPDAYMKLFEEALETRVTRHTVKMMKKQNVPRAKYSDSIDLSIYRRCGWEPPKKGLSENHELKYRRDRVSGQASTEAMQVLDELCDDYEAQHLGGPFRKNGTNYI